MKQSDIFHSKLMANGLLSKSIGIHVIRQTVLQRKQRQIYENQQLQIFSNDWGFDVQKSVKTRVKKHCEVLDSWNDVREIIKGKM